MIITKTPFRISFAGGGSDMRSFYKLKNGSVLSTTINKHIYVIVKKQLGIVEFKYRVNWSQTEFKNSINDIQHPIVRESLKYFKINFPIEITTFSDIPSNTGLASSSAFAVGLVHALLVLQKKKISKHKIAQIAAVIEVNILKRNIGKQDHFACSYGGLNKITFYKDEKVLVKKIYPKANKIRKLQENLELYYTSVKRNASNILKSQMKLNKNQVEYIKKLTDLVDPAIKILTDKTSNLDLFGEILHKGWEVKRKVNNKISNQKLNDYYLKAIRQGASGGKILGAGNGGFFLFYIKYKKKKKLSKSLNQLKNLKFNFDTKGTTVTYNDQKK